MNCTLTPFIEMPGPVAIRRCFATFSDSEPSLLAASNTVAAQTLRCHLFLALGQPCSPNYICRT
jgi:hypothetical protein